MKWLKIESQPEASVMLNEVQYNRISDYIGNLAMMFKQNKVWDKTIEETLNELKQKLVKKVIVTENIQNSLHKEAAGERANVLKALEKMKASLEDLYELGNVLVPQMNEIGLERNTTDMFQKQIVNVIGLRIIDILEDITEDVRHLEM